jgi:agarase
MKRLLVACLLAFAAGAFAVEPEDPGYDAWGGWLGITTAATGRFRVEQINGVWWLVTPDGHGFFSIGIDHLRPEGDFSPPLGTSPYQDNILALYGSEAGWAAATRPRLTAFGINTIGAFSRPELFPNSIAYTIRLAMAQNAPLVPGVPPPLVDRDTRDYFDPAFGAGVAADVTSTVAPCAADPWCLGIFTDNELGLNQSLAQSWPYLDSYLLLPPGAPGKVAVQAFLDDRYAGDVAAFNAVWGTSLATFDDVQTLSGLTPAPALSPGAPVGTAAQTADRRAFDARVAGRFHQVTYDAVRAQAPGVLILGSRLLVLSTRPEVLEAIAPYVDVITINYYEIAADILALVPNYPTDYGIPFQRMFDDVDAMYRIAGKPMLIGEFGYRAADAGLPNTLPPFFPTLATQADRAQALGTYLRRVIARPYLVGAHWFQYMDQPATGRFDGENQNFGLVKITDETWPEVTERLHAISSDAAPRRALAAGRGGSSRSDCLVEWSSTTPISARLGRAGPPARYLCVDGDPSCDTDDVPDQCTIEIIPCSAIVDSRLPLCPAMQPPAVEVSLRRSADPALESSLASSLASVLSGSGAQPGSCGGAVPVVMPLAGRRKARVTLRVAAQGMPAGDRDTVRLVCKRSVP